MLSLLALLAWCVGAPPDPAWTSLDRAYKALQTQEYDTAIAAFQEALVISPSRVDVRKDLAYTYVKTGETILAREQFAEVVKLQPSDVHASLEYAYLCYETRQPAEARRTFDRLRKTGNPDAAQAFENIDLPLRDGIKRWQQAITIAPDNFSNHEELARLAEQRDELDLAAKQYEIASKLRPDLRYLQFDVGRVRTAQGDAAGAMPYLLAASRGGEPRTAERARAMLPPRYPYVYEFRQAIQLDPENVELRRELAYLFLEMGNQPEAEAAFAETVRLAPDDLLSQAQLGFLELARGDREAAMPRLERVMGSGEEELADRVRTALRLPQTMKQRTDTPRAQVSGEAKTLAGKSLEKGYLKDALKYLTIAHENDPVDFEVMLKLGWANNMLHDDREAVHWFRLASKSPDAKVASEAAGAYRNLAPEFARFRTTLWFLPFYSSRWNDLFAYGQLKTEYKPRALPLRPYLSLRFIGDARGEAYSSVMAGPQYLSESSVIAGAGIATTVWKGLMGWSEAGWAIGYRSGPNAGHILPDYRGGAAYGRAWGHGIDGESSGPFFETNLDGVYLSRFGWDVLGYTQTRTGYTLRETGPVRWQVLWHANWTIDTQRQAWANYAEIGPGVRFRIRSMPPALMFSVNYLRGLYLVSQGNLYPSTYSDFRAGLWYAFTR
jgi:Tfp pilus assembly protein PilF